MEILTYNLVNIGKYVYLQYTAINPIVYKYVSKVCNFKHPDSDDTWILKFVYLYSVTTVSGEILTIPNKRDFNRSVEIIYFDSDLTPEEMIFEIDRILKGLVEAVTAFYNNGG